MIGRAKITNWWFVFLLQLSGLCGCQFEPPKPVNPNVAPVTGRVTLDGKPLPKADLTFESLSSRPSSAITDEDGRYELTFDQFSKGALLGTHLVRITMQIRPLDPGPRPKPLPGRYNTNTELKVQVVPGENIFDFNLVSDSPAADPPSKTPLDQSTP